MIALEADHCQRGITQRQLIAHCSMQAMQLSIIEQSRRAHEFQCFHQRLRVRCLPWANRQRSTRAARVASRDSPSRGTGSARLQHEAIVTQTSKPVTKPSLFQLCERCSTVITAHKKSCWPELQSKTTGCADGTSIWCVDLSAGNKRSTNSGSWSSARNVASMSSEAKLRRSRTW